MINITKLHQELLASNLPVDGVHEDGTIDWTRELTESEKGEYWEVLAVHDPVEIVLPGIDERLSAIEDAMLAQILGGM